METSRVALDCWYLTGPTASGKTAVSLSLAERLGAEIVSLDSMAVYRGMDVGTAKPTLEERGRIAHHLVDVAEPTEDYSLARYVEEAHTAVDAIHDRGGQVLFVGGTPLYLKAMLRGIFSGPPADWKFRQELEAKAEGKDEGFLHRQLAAVDPQAAERLHPRDTRRLIRALEVFEKSGRPISEWQATFDQPRLTPESSRVFLLSWPRVTLFERIERRVDAMFAAGLVEEARGLLERYGALGRTARQAVGYREAWEYLDGMRDLAETVKLVKTRTRQFARRQKTWFRSLMECRAIEMTGNELPEDVAERIVKLAQTN